MKTENRKEKAVQGRSAKLASEPDRAMSKQKSAKAAPSLERQADDTGTTTSPGRTGKKARQRALLLKIAARLFMKNGFAGTRIEDIAVEADISVPTVYAYFSSKRELLIEYLSETRHETLPVYDEVLANPPAAVDRAVAMLLYVNIREIRSREEKALWRELVSTRIAMNDHYDDKFDKSIVIFKAYIKKLLVHFVSTNQLDGSISLDVAVDMIYAVSVNNFHLLIASNSWTPERIWKRTEEQMMTFFGLSNVSGAARDPGAKSRSQRG